MEQTERSHHTSISTFDIIIIVIVVGFLIFSGTAQVFPCPHCGGGYLRYICPYCGGDGRVTLFEYIAYYLLYAH